MTDVARSYSIGTPGTPWGDTEKAAWLAARTVQRSYEADVVSAIEALRNAFEIVEYGQLDYGARRYRLYALKSLDWRDDLPIALVTGGVHGYETSGVHGALRFVRDHASRYQGRINLLVVPCVSPWGYETIQRWNPRAIDPNRSFREDSPAAESAALLRLVAPLRDRVLLHIDLHESTDTDETEYFPALAARDGVAFNPVGVQDGFYVVDDSEQPRPEFQSAIIEAVSRITHIAPADAKGNIIGSPVVSRGVIRYPLRQLALCAGITDAYFRTTTEVYPDSPSATPEECIRAQVTAVCAAIDFAIASGSR